MSEGGRGIEPVEGRLPGIEPVDALPDGCRQLHLTGFMGTGKSTVGRLLARRLVWNFLDLDAVVVRAAGRSIPEIFAEEGEEAFRRREHQALRQVVQKPRTVVALGGGTLIDRRNREICAASASLVWLDVPLEVARARLDGTGDGAERADGVGGTSEADGSAERPLWGDADELEDRLRERLPGYRTAGFRVSADAEPEAVADAVLGALGLDPTGNRG